MVTNQRVLLIEHENLGGLREILDEMIGSAISEYANIHEIVCLQIIEPQEYCGWRAMVVVNTVDA